MSIVKASPQKFLFLKFHCCIEFELLNFENNFLNDRKVPRPALDGIGGVPAYRQAGRDTR